MTRNHKISGMSLEVMPDGTVLHHRKSDGATVRMTNETIVNKALVKHCHVNKLGRIVAYNGSKYYILPNERIISLNPSSLGKEVYATGEQRKQILAIGQK